MSMYTVYFILTMLVFVFFSLMTGAVHVWSLHSQKTRTRKRRKYIKGIIGVDDDAVCIQKLEKRVIDEWVELDEKYGKSSNRLDSAPPLSRLSSTGLLCNELLEEDRRIVILIKNLEETEKLCVPVTVVHMTMVEAHNQIIENLNRATLFLSADGCLDNTEKNAEKFCHRDTIESIRDANKKIVVSAEELLRQTIMLVTMDRTDQIVACLNLASSEIASARQSLLDKSESPE